MSAKLRAHIRGNIVGYVALFFALSTGSAVALSGSNTVFTDDIVNDQVRSDDVRNDTLGGGGLAAADLRANSVGQSEIAAGGVAASEILNGSVGTAAFGTIPAARATATSSQSVPDNTTTTISFDSEAGEGFDTASLHDNAVNNSRLTAPVTGAYLVSAGLRWQVNSTGVRGIQITSSGGSEIATNADEPVSSAVDRDQAVSDVAHLTAGDYVELKVFQNSGGALNSLAGGANNPHLSMVWLGP